MTTRTGNFVVTSKVATTYSRYEDRRCTLLLHRIDNLLQALLIGCRGRRASSVTLHGSGIRGIAFGSVVSLQFQVIHTIVFPVVVCKLYKHVVARLHIILRIVPQLIIAGTRIASALGVVDRCPAVGQEVSEIHTPSTGIRSVLVIRCHRRITQGVHLLSAARYST